MSKEGTELARVYALIEACARDLLLRAHATGSDDEAEQFRLTANNLLEIKAIAQSEAALTKAGAQ